MKLHPRMAWQLGSLACVLSLHVSNLNAQPLTILAGPITNTANGHIYYLLAPTNWIGSWFNARRVGGRLVTINDAAENAWVFDTFANYGGVARNLWLGLNDAAQEGSWVWDSGDPSIYRNWAPGEPDNGGAGGNEDYVVMRGPALSSPGTWNDVSGDITNAPVVEKIPPAPPATGPFDVAADFSTNQNPNGVWSYGYSTTLGGPMTLHAQRDNWAGLDFWRTDISLGVPGVYFNPANHTVTNATGTVVLGPRQLSCHPGPNGVFCVIRFTAPTNGQYQISGAFTGVDTNGTTTDVHILVNGIVINGVVNGFGPGSGPPFDLTASLQAGDRLDFAVGRGSNDFSFDSTGLSAAFSRTNPPIGVAPTITAQPQSWTVPVGADVSFFVSATGTAPLGYQWRHEGTNLPGATSSSLTLSNVQPANAGTYSVRVSNAVGVAISSNATLTVFTPGTNCVARPAGLVAWWRAEGNAYDSAGTNHGTTPFGIAYAAGEVGEAFDFDGREVTVPGSPDFFVTNAFTIEGWFYVREGAYSAQIFTLGPIGLWKDWLENVGFAIQTADLQVFGLQSPIQTNQWYHIAATFERTNGTMTLYVDGVARAQTNTGANTAIRPFETLGAGPIPRIVIGNTDGWVRAPFNGLIDELSLYSRALSSNEVHAIYSADGAGKCLDGLIPLILSHPTNQTVAAGSNATFTVMATGAPLLNYQWRHYGTNLPSATGASLTLTNVQSTDAGTYSVLVSNLVGVAISSNASLTTFTPGTNCAARPPGLVSWWRAEGNANDSAGTNHGESRIGFDGPAYAAGQVGQAFDFNGNQVAQIPFGSYFMLTNSLTIEGWIYAREPSSVWDKGLILSLGDLGGDYARLSLVPSPRSVAFEFNNVEVESVASLLAPVQANQWHHIAATLEDTTGTVTLYVDGVARAQTNNVIGQGFGLFMTRRIWIGGAVGGARWTYYLVFPFNGLIDEPSLYSRALSSNEVQAIYSAGSAGKCTDGLAPLILSHPTNQTVAAGANITFAVTATGAPLLNYQWRHEGTNLAGATGTSLTMTNVQPTDAGTYSVLVSNTFGVAISSNAALTVLMPGTTCVARPPGLVSWWRAEGIANDSAGTNHGSLAGWGGVTYAPGEVGQAFAFFDGAVIAAAWPYSSVLTNSFAVEGWVYAWQANNGVIFSLDRVIELTMEPSAGNVAFEVGNQSVSLQAPIQIGQWHHIAATFEVTSGTMTLYIDGVERARTNTVSRPSDPNPSWLWIGGTTIFAGAVVSPFYGLIDELSLYSRALSANEVHAIYSAGGAGKCLDGLTPLIVSHPTNQTVAVGSNAAFTVTATGAPLLNYQWRHEGTNLPGATGASLTLTNVQSTDAGAYSVLVSNTFGVAASSNAVLTVTTPFGRGWLSVRHADGSIRLQFFAPRGYSYAIEASTNLLDWERIGAAAEAGEEEFEFEDAQPTLFPRRFYRIVSP